MHLRIVSDRIRLGDGKSELPDWVEKEIRNRSLVTGNGNLVSFCGIFAKQGAGIWVFVPRGMSFPQTQESNVRIAALVTSCIERYARQSLTRVNANTAEEGIQGEGLISVIRELLEDYRINGLYVTTSRQSVINHGKTDWKRTFSKISPFPDADGIPVYPVLLGNRSNRSFDNIVTAIHASVISHLDKMFGWWITGNPEGRVAPDLEEVSGLLAREAYCLALLHRERSMIYADRSLRLIGNLIRYFEKSSDGAESPVVIGLRDFHWAWEHMLGEVLPFRAFLNQQLPVPVYYLKNGARAVAANSSMRTDIILENPEACSAVVVDAKYYAASGVDNSPGWPDLVKQFFYAKALKTIRPNYSISSVFVFPGTNGNMSHVYVESRDGKFVHDAEFPPVQCIYANVEELMLHFLAGTKYRELESAVFGSGS